MHKRNRPPPLVLEKIPVVVTTPGYGETTMPPIDWTTYRVGECARACAHRTQHPVTCDPGCACLRNAILRALSDELGGDFIAHHFPGWTSSQFQEALMRWARQHARLRPGDPINYRGWLEESFLLMPTHSTAATPSPSAAVV